MPRLRREKGHCCGAAACNPPRRGCEASPLTERRFPPPWTVGKISQWRGRSALDLEQNANHSGQGVRFDVQAATYLSELNGQQRRAVEHGVGQDDNQGPLLVIAGAGSGKTKTLAHRVAHLIVNGADPRRILLLTFSRRAATELARRVQRISAQVLGTSSKSMTDALTWAGTFHGIGARLLREFCRPHRSRSFIHNPRPRGFGRSHESGTASMRLVENRKPIPN